MSKLQPSGVLMSGVLVLLCIMLHTISTFNGSFVEAISTKRQTGSVREWLIFLEEEASTLDLTASQLEKVISLLSKKNSASLSMRKENLAKVKTAYTMLLDEIQILNSTCMAFDGPDCNISRQGCGIRCSVCASESKCSKCSGNWDGETCSSCKSGWGGPNCDQEKLLSSSNNIFIFGSGLKSCAEYKKEFNNSAVNGLYWIKPDSTKPEFVVYCEQSFNGGGWALVSSRSSSIPPKYSDIVQPNSDGSSMRDDKWAILRSNSTELLWKDAASNEHAISLISVWSEAGNCKPLTKNLSDSIVAHIETSGCDGKGMDYCLLGGNPSDNSYIYSLCGNSSNLYKQWQFSGQHSYVPQSNMYVR